MSASKSSDWGDSESQFALWDEFLKAWPLDRLATMSLDEYSQTGENSETGQKDTLTAWLEIKTEDLGSIWGGSAFKFGIYHRNDTEAKEPKGGRIWGDEYAWYSKYGDTSETAFAQVRERIITIAEAARAGNLDAIDKVDFSEAVKWKIAFLYQPRESPLILSAYKRDALIFCYRQIDPNASQNTPLSLVYSGLMDQMQDGEDVFKLSERLWKTWEQIDELAPQYWVIPLHWLFPDDEEVEAFLEKDAITGEDIPDKFNQLLVKSEVRVKDHLALLLGKTVRALAEVTNAEAGDFAWTQEKRDFIAPIASIPTDAAKKLTSNEIAQIWQMSAPTQTDDEPSAVEKAAPAPPPKNIILYGPPGTGKTYHTVKRSLELILGAEKVAKMSRDTQTRQFRELQRKGRVEFVTFHQNYGYEEFVEGLRPVLSESASQEVQYEIHDGVFKRIALRAAAAGLPDATNLGTSFETLWRTFIEQLRDEGHRLVKSAGGVDYVLDLSSQDNVRALRCHLDENGEITEQATAGMIASKANSKLIWDHRETLGPDPEDVTSDKTTKLFAETRGSGGGHHFTGLWLVYNELWNLSKEIGTTSESAADLEARAQEAIDKPTAGVAEFGFTEQTKQHVLVIDEINRGNISKILGEMITLLEPEKRLGQPEELKLPLAYTPEHRFGVPPNLHIIGTMNTADRSIALMDVALRRRFTFEEMMPQAEVIVDVIAKATDNMPLANLTALLFEAINGRIRFLYDRDHQLGHAYFLKVRSLEDLRQLFVDKLIPLLQEYFYEAWDKICVVLGCPFDESGSPARSGDVIVDGAYRAPVIVATPLDSEVLSGWDNEDYEGRLDYAIAPALLDPETPFAELLPYFLCVTNLPAAEQVHFTELLSELHQQATEEGSAE